jgi:hypothetical protein
LVYWDGEDPWRRRGPGGGPLVSWDGEDPWRGWSPCEGLAGAGGRRRGWSPCEWLAWSAHGPLDAGRVFLKPYHAEHDCHGPLGASAERACVHVSAAPSEGGSEREWLAWSAHGPLGAGRVFLKPHHAEHDCHGPLGASAERACVHVSATPSEGGSVRTRAAGPRGHETMRPCGHGVTRT